MGWLIDLIATITQGFNQIVDMLINFHGLLVDANSGLQATPLAITNNPAIGTNATGFPVIMYNSLQAYKYVVGDYLFYVSISMVLFGIAYGTFNFIRELKTILHGDKGLLEKSNNGILGWIAKIFKRG